MSELRAIARTGATVIQAGRDVINGNIFLGEYIRLRDAWLDPAPVFDEVDIERFTGREWLRDQVDDFIAHHDHGYIVIQAAAGLGKTAFAAWLTRSHGAPSHFTRRYKGRMAATALRNLAVQLIARYGLANRFAPDGTLPSTAGEPGWFYQVLRSAAETATSAGEHVMIVVDGLDEAEHIDGDLPLGLPATLPRGVFVVATCRTGTDLPQLRRPCTVLRIDARAAANTRDLRLFLGAAGDVLPEGSGMAEVLIQRCGGVWIYLKYVLAELRDGTRDTDGLGMLPVDLAGYYQESLCLPSDDAAWLEVRLPVLATLAAIGEPLPLATIARLAGLTNVGPVRGLCQGRLRPFLTVSEEGVDRRYGIYHASLREFLGGRLPVHVLDSVRDRADELAQSVRAAHHRIAEDYLTSFGGLSDDLPLLAVRPELAEVDGGYPLRQLAYHLEQAGRTADLHGLLACERHSSDDVGGNVWFDAHSHAGTLSDYLADVRRAQRLVELATDTLISNGRYAATLGLEVRYAVLAAAVATFTTNVPATLLARLVESGVWPASSGLGYARRTRDAHRRAEALLGLLPTLAEQDRPAVLAECRATVDEIDDDERIDALIRMMPLTPESDRPQRAEHVVSAIDAAPDLSSPASALLQVVEFLPDDAAVRTWQRILRETTLIEDEEARADLIEEMADDLPDSLLPDVLAIVRGLDDEKHRTWALYTLCDRLAGPLLEDAHRIASAIGAHHHRACALSGVAAAMSEPARSAVLRQALSAARDASDDWDHSWALLILLPLLSVPDQREVASEAAQVATGLDDPVDRAKRLVQIAGWCPQDLRAEVVAAASDAIRHVEDDTDRIEALCDLAAQLPDEEALIRIAEALAITRRIESEDVRSDVVAYLAPRVPEQSMAGLLDIAGELVVYRVWSIATLAPHLPDHLLGDALRLAEKITDDHGRAQFLGALAQQVAPPKHTAVLAEAVAAARACADGYSRADTLAELAGGHEAVNRDALVAESLAAARVEASDYRAEALGHAARHMPRAQREEVSAEALLAAREISRLDYRVRVIGGLIPWLPADAAREAIVEALAVARTIDTDYVRIVVLAVIATEIEANGRSAVLDETMNAALASSDQDEAPMSALHRMARYLQLAPRRVREDLFATASKAALTLDETRRLELIYDNAHLLRRLPGLLLARLLDAVRSVPPTYNHTPVLGPIAVHLPEPYAGQAITEVLRQTGRGTRLARRGILDQVARQVTSRAVTPADMRLLRRCLDTTSLEECFSVLAAGVPLLVAAGGPGVVDDCLETAHATQRWWRAPE